jgi:hypothetical protein
MMNESDLTKLRKRLARAEESLRKLADEYAKRASEHRGLDEIDYWTHYDRLTAKAEGVRLALAYVEEALREY